MGRCGRTGGTTTVVGGGWVRRRQAVLRQASEQNRRRPAGMNRCWQTGQASVWLWWVVAGSSRDGPLGSAAMVGDPLAEPVGAGSVGAHPVGLALDVEHHRSVQQP